MLGAVPELSIGAMSGNPKYLLSGVVGGLRLADGRIVIGAGDEVRFFGAEGRFAGAHGAEVGGQGNYGFIRGLARCGEGGLAGLDRDLQIHLYDDDGSFMERRQPLAADGRAPLELACDEHAHVVALGGGAAVVDIPLGELQKSHAHLSLMTSDGSTATDFGEWLVSERIGTEAGSQPHPFGRATVFALSEDLLYVGSGERFEIEVRSLDGALLRILRGPELELAITDEVRLDYQNALLEQTPERFRSMAREQLGELPWPDEGPAYTAMRIDSSGLVWLRQRTPPGYAPERWSIMDPEEGYLGDLALPNRASLLDAGDDYLLVLTRDEFDVLKVVLLSLDRGTP